MLVSGKCIYILIFLVKEENIAATVCVSGTLWSRINLLKVIITCQFTEYYGKNQIMNSITSGT